MSKNKKKDKTQTYLVIGVVALLGFMTINIAGDLAYRTVQLEINEGMIKNWQTQSNINGNNDKIHFLETEVLEQLDEDVRNNMKVIDQLIGIIMRDEF